MSQAFLKWQGPAENGQPKLKSREEKLPPYRGKNYPTRNFSGHEEREEILPHCEKIHGAEISPTSISTRATVAKSATAEPVGCPQRSRQHMLRLGTMPALRLKTT